MFRQVIAGVDGTPRGRDAAVLASRLVTSDGRVSLVNVYNDDGPWSSRGINVAEILRQDSLELLVKEQAAIGVDADNATVGASSVGAGLHHIAEERNADLIVVGSSSRGPTGRLLLGDDMRACLEGASCAIAVAPRGYANDPTTFTTIGVAYDGEPASDAALELAREFAREHTSRITALTVITIPTYAYGGPAAVVAWPQLRDEMVGDAQQRLDHLGDVDGHAVEGVPVDELVRLSASVDLLVIGSRGYGPARRMLSRSTSEYVAHHAHCPLIVLRRGATDMRAETPSAPVTFEARI
jgi:nucleotide-binding universal stress UspA family protein